MSSNAKVVIAVASGYLLGRSKKMKLAITVGSMLAGQRIATDPRGLLKQGQQLVEGNEELSQIQEQVQSKLLEAAKAAALATLSSRMELFSDSLRDRTDSLRGLAGELEEAADVAEEQEPEDEAEEQEPEDERSQDEQSVDEQSEDDEAKESTAKKAPAKKAASKRSSSSGTAKKSTAKKAPAKKAPAKKAPAKKAPATKAAARKR